MCHSRKADYGTSQKRSTPEGAGSSRNRWPALWGRKRPARRDPGRSGPTSPAAMRERVAGRSPWRPKESLRRSCKARHTRASRCGAGPDASADGLGLPKGRVGRRHIGATTGETYPPPRGFVGRLGGRPTAGPRLDGAGTAGGPMSFRASSSCRNFFSVAMIAATALSAARRLASCGLPFPMIASARSP
jgi:hypothetical protein